MVEATFTCLRKYTNFSSRASRSEFWKFVLAIFLAFVAAIIVNSMVFGPEQTTTITMTKEASGEMTQGYSYQTNYSDGVFGDIIALAVVVPFFAALWRRMNDVGRPGWHGASLWAVSLTLTGYAGLGFLVDTNTTAELQTSLGGLEELIQEPQPPMFLRVAMFISWTVTLVLSGYWLTKASVHDQGVQA
ncbi:MAG: DUF805 domain-containing protein [Paracoccaceae bacterium]|nr:DUF805 domain-containing protein [Paracoccaceae bacterium]